MNKICRPGPFRTKWPIYINISQVNGIYKHIIYSIGIFSLEQENTAQEEANI